MTPEIMAAAQNVKTKLDAAEAAHPCSPELAALHQALYDLSQALRPLVGATHEEMAAFGGGTPKTVQNLGGQ